MHFEVFIFLYANICEKTKYLLFNVNSKEKKRFYIKKVKTDIYLNKKDR
jgi:hypothetical protein